MQFAHLNSVGVYVGNWLLDPPDDVPEFQRRRSARVAGAAGGCGLAFGMIRPA
jgi:hypothetical protein